MYFLRKSPGGLTYIGEFKSGKTTATMAHLTCFAGGMIALGSQIDPKLSASEKQRQMNVSTKYFQKKKYSRHKFRGNWAQRGDSKVMKHVIFYKGGFRLVQKADSSI